MKIGCIEIDLEELLSNPPVEPLYCNPLASKNCDCDECRKILMRDAWFMWHDDEHIDTEEKLSAAVSSINWSDDA